MALCCPVDKSRFFRLAPEVPGPLSTLLQISACLIFCVTETHFPVLHLPRGLWVPDPLLCLLLLLSSSSLLLPFATTPPTLFSWMILTQIY